MTEKEIAFDSNYLYVDGEKFFPILQELEDGKDPLESVNGVVIRVPCLEDVVWEDVYALAEKAAELDKWILWDLDFGFQEKRVFLQDTAVFFAHGIAIDEFIKKLWTPFLSRTLGASLFRGGVDFAKYFVWTEEHEQLYLEKSRESAFLRSDPSLEEMGRKLFAADVFSEYLHRLSSFLPDQILPFCFLDVSAIESCAFLSLLLSKDRFQHLLLVLKKSSLPLGCLNWEDGGCFGGWVGRGAPYFSVVREVKVGVCIPLEESMSLDLVHELEGVFSKLADLNISYRVISELYLNESWDGIDELIVLSVGVSRQGMRKLRGFLAAGGQVVYVGEPLGLESEVSLLEFTAQGV